MIVPLHICPGIDDTLNQNYHVQTSCFTLPLSYAFQYYTV